MKLKTFKNAVLILTLVLAREPAFSQGFVNLDFESPVLPLIPDFNGYVPIANALPGWTGYFGGDQTSGIFYNNVSIGAAMISLHSTASSFQPIYGNYTVILQPSFPDLNVLPAIAQTGTVPADAQSIRYYSKTFYRTAAVSFAGQALQGAILGGSSDTGFLFAADISGFAGQTGELRFFGGGYLDNIQFSPQAIPEPSVFCLFTLGSLLLGWRFLVGGF